ncbi:hypothetical protein M406DRAFT_339961 [Cryphonectria parasitica EP155]|uniref:Cupin type-2 domain-containing protein n=1 Tax=Cryphonectria parasitica (strain ATCC 38755 / EP155) TaxID=660469 RepID=A0A9P4Y0W4_CRYP1|nr:uncharacterized protein M406DRAFT_339961 [Cryphonectria parasitica EP155]KAF3764335.1 hypothetical protein M406DRAFT_339961 [Cryphonectria parasitica EP155]
MADAQASISTSVSAPPTDPNRHITTNNSDAKAVFSTIPAPLQVTRDLGGTLFRLGYQTPRPPVSFTENKDLNAYAQSLDNPPPLVPPGGGAVVWYVDTPPGAISPVHRTVSLDIVIQVQGELELHLDGGETRLLKPGDMTVQRATMHAWRNPSETTWSRMIAVMSECEPAVVGGETLGTFFPPAGH